MLSVNFFLRHWTPPESPLAAHREYCARLSGAEVCPETRARPFRGSRTKSPSWNPSRGCGPATGRGRWRRDRACLASCRRHRSRSSWRRPGGGYRLSREAKEIAGVAVRNAIDEKIDTTRCHGQANCQNGQRCLTHELWFDLSKQIHDFLSGIT